MCRMLIVGYCFGIRSERRLCDEVHLNLAYRWFCQLGIKSRPQVDGDLSNLINQIFTGDHFARILNKNF